MGGVFTLTISVLLGLSFLLILVGGWADILLSEATGTKEYAIRWAWGIVWVLCGTGCVFFGAWTTYLWK